MDKATNAPSFILPFLAALVLGWFGIRFLSRWASRPRRARLQGLVAALRTDERYSLRDHALIEEALKEARATAMSAALPLLVPVILAVLAAAGLLGRLGKSAGTTPLERIEWARFREEETRLLVDTRDGQGTIRADPRFRRLAELAFETEAFRWPVLSLATILLSLPALLLYAVAFGPREAVPIVPQLAFILHRRLGFLTRRVSSATSPPGP